MIPSQISEYRLKRADLETYLKNLFGQRDFRIKVAQNPKRRKLSSDSPCST